MSTPPLPSPARPPSSPATGALCLGIDLGGTKTEVAVLDAAGAFRLRRRVPTPRGDYAATVATIRDLVLAAERELGQPLPVGVGIPGAISPASGLVKNANSTWLNGRPLRQDLESALARPVPIENDANCLAVSEAVDGAAAGARCVFAVILGTGVGAGIGIDGRPLTGRDAIAGEWGHNPLPPAWPAIGAEQPGPRCWCGRYGCIETWLSGPGFARDHQQHRGARDHRDHRPARQAPVGANGGEPAAAPDAAAIFAAARAGDARAIASRTRYLDRLGRALAGVVNLLDPDVIVLGGGLSNEPTLFEALPARIAPHVFSDRFTTPIRPPRHGDSSGVRGAARLSQPPEGLRPSPP